MNKILVTGSTGNLGRAVVTALNTKGLNVRAAARNPGLVTPDTDYRERKPQVNVAVDRDRAADLGVSLQTVGRTLETMLGSRVEEFIATMSRLGEWGYSGVQIDDYGSLPESSFTTLKQAIRFARRSAEL